MAGHTTLDTISEPDPMGLDALSEPVDIVSSGGIPGQHVSIKEPSALNDASTSVADGEPQHATEPATDSSRPAENTGHARPRNNHATNSGVSIAHDSTIPDITAEGLGSSSEQHGHDITPTATATDEFVHAKVAFSQYSIVAPNEQDLTQARTPTEYAREKAAGLRSEIVIQSASGEVQRRDVYGSPTVGVEVPASTAMGVQTGSQSTASQASERTSSLPAAKPSPQEITLAELRAQKVALLSSLRVQPAIQVLMEENNDDDDGEPTEADIMAAANKIVKEHIKLLHDYNELKDVGQGLMGLIADQRGVRIVEIQDEFGIDAND